MIALGACSNTSFYDALGDKIKTPQLAISPPVAAATGTQNITWQAYASTTPSISGSATLLQSGVMTTRLAPSASSSPVTFTGAWPTSTGAYYLVVTVSSSESLVTSGSTGATGPITITAAQVSYNLTSVSYNGSPPIVPGATVSGTFTMKNTGPNDGTQSVTWQAFASTVPTTTAPQC